MSTFANDSDSPDSAPRRRMLATAAAIGGGSALSPWLQAAAAPTPHPTGTSNMTSTTITTKDGVQIFYKDWGSGQPIVFSHGWPLSADDWDAQMIFFLQHGFRVVAHDRRGHGRSTQKADGHDMDHYADDLGRRRSRSLHRASR
jgi:non-heme chloroperoxidase